jgi:hypothetical protein
VLPWRVGDFKLQEAFWEMVIFSWDTRFSAARREEIAVRGGKSHRKNARGRLRFTKIKLPDPSQTSKRGRHGRHRGEKEGGKEAQRNQSQKQEVEIKQQIMKNVQIQIPIKMQMNMNMNI